MRAKGQYALAFGVVAALLFWIGFPVFLLFFFGVLAFFIWKAFSITTRNEAREIFDFYLSTNEIVREDGRRWFGFEVQEAIAKGEAIVKHMPTPPPLIHFALGALYQKAGDHSSAVRHLSAIAGDNIADESAIVYPNRELREYVRVLRQIESSPAEAPRTSAAVRSLERIRKNKAKEMLEFSQAALADGTVKLPASSVAETKNEADLERDQSSLTYNFADFAASKKKAKDEAPLPESERRTISEVLHDIYDEKAQ